jgi:tRNA pseudouridine13 synthase
VYDRDVPEPEAALGLGFFASQTPGIGGQLKVQAEDFRVDEDSAPVPDAEGSGKYTLARVRARNWETHRLARKLAAQVGIDQREVYFTGTKDKRAVTEQNIAIRAPEADVRAVNLGDVEIVDTWRVDRAPKLGEHEANTFHVRVRDLEPELDEARRRAEAIRDELLDLGGFPNFFGPQRFGSVRPVTHLVGRELVHGSLADAVWTYIAYPSRFDPPDVRETRERIYEERDVEEAKAELPSRFDHEHRMLEHLAEAPGDAVGAIETLPLNLARLFVSAYQSYLFNQALTLRAGEAHPGRAEPGDVLVPIDEEGNPDKDRAIPVRDGNLDRCREATDRGWGLPTGLLPGHQETPAGGIQGESERRVLADEDVCDEDFHILELPKLSQDGTRRPLWCPLDHLQVEAGEDDRGKHVTLSFTLPKGSYATCVLREFMKTDPSAYG